MKSVIIGGLKINYLEKKSDIDKTVVFIHGNSHSLRTFREQFEDQRLEKYRLVALDLPGHGKSAKAQEYSLPFFSDTLANFVEELRLTSYVLAGHSLGGHIAAESLDRLSPDGLLSFGAPFLPKKLEPEAFKPNEVFPLFFKESLEADELSTLADSLFAGEVDTTIEKEDIMATDNLFKKLLMESNLAGKLKDEVGLLNDFQGPKAIVHGKNDDFVNYDYLCALTIKNLWKNKVQLVSGGHDLHVESAREFNGLLLEFLEDVWPK